MFLRACALDFVGRLDYLKQLNECWIKQSEILIPLIHFTSWVNVVFHIELAGIYASNVLGRRDKIG